MRYELLQREATELRPAITDPLRLYNREKNSAFFTARDLPENAPKPLYIVAYDEQGDIAGGLIAESQFAWLKIEIVAVRAEVRQRGVGSHLMRLAEEEGLRRGCKYAFLDTMSYQAPQFYQKAGYRIAGKIADWDSHGNTKYFFTKSLA
jgi:ribosomal protein S18 acetylase RimI-like enzyme